MDDDVLFRNYEMDVMTGSIEGFVMKPGCSLTFCALGLFRRRARTNTECNLKEPTLFFRPGS